MSEKTKVTQYTNGHRYGQLTHKTETMMLKQTCGKLFHFIINQGKQVRFNSSSIKTISTIKYMLSSLTRVQCK